MYSKFWYTLDKIEKILIYTLLLSVLVLSLSQIILRNIYDEGIVWMDALLRAHVLWIALIGAMLAVGEKRHISITFMEKYMKGYLN